VFDSSLSLSLSLSLSFLSTGKEESLSLSFFLAEEEEEEEDRYRRVVERTMVQCSQCGSCTCSPLLYHLSVVTHFFLRTVRSKSEEASNNAVQYVGRTTLFFVVYVALFVGMPVEYRTVPVRFHREARERERQGVCVIKKVRMRQERQER